MATLDSELSFGIMNNHESIECILDLSKGNKLLLTMDRKLSIPDRRLLANILKAAINDMNDMIYKDNDHEGCFYFNLCDLYPNLDLETAYYDSADVINSLLKVSRNTSIIWFHEDAEGNHVYDGWASLIGEISWLNKQWLQYNVPTRVRRYLKDKSVAPWILASLEKGKFPKIL